jgi:MHS family alpha-ketoglutarate permease-like MFS transporter
VIAVSLFVYLFFLKNKSANWLDDAAAMDRRTMR